MKTPDALPWNHERDFHDRETGLCVRIASRTLTPLREGFLPKKHYSIEVGMFSESGSPLYSMVGGTINDGMFSRYFRIVMHTEGDKVSMPGRIDGMVIANLITSAERWIIEEEQKRQDIITHRKRTQRKEVPR